MLSLFLRPFARLRWIVLVVGLSVVVRPGTGVLVTRSDSGQQQANYSELRCGGGSGHLDVQLPPRERAGIWKRGAHKWDGMR